MNLNFYLTLNNKIMDITYEDYQSSVFKLKQSVHYLFISLGSFIKMGVGFIRLTYSTTGLRNP